jgi:hypothetical protein
MQCRKHYTVNNRTKEREAIKDDVKERGGVPGAERLHMTRNTAGRRTRMATNVNERLIQSRQSAITVEKKDTHKWKAVRLSRKPKQLGKPTPVEDHRSDEEMYPAEMETEIVINRQMNVSLSPMSPITRNDLRGPPPSARR